MRLQKIRLGRGSNQPARQNHGCGDTSLRTILDAQARGLAIALVEARTGIGESDTTSPIKGKRSQAGTIILNRYFQHSLDATGADPDLPSGGTASDSVADRIFHERLQNHMRHRGRENLRVRRNFDLKAVLKAHLLDG
jgi:hypothetical protein